MNIIDKITHHHDDEKNAVEDALPAQKIRVSIERRVHNAQKLIQDEIPENAADLEKAKHNALAKLHDFRLACEKMLNLMVE